MGLSIPSNIDVDTLAESMADQLTHEELLDFISTLDLCVGEWSFTEDLYKWTKTQHKFYKNEFKEYS